MPDDLGVLAPDFRRTLAAWYRDLAEVEQTTLGNPERAAYCRGRAYVLEAEGEVTLAALLEGSCSDR